MSNQPDIIQFGMAFGFGVVAPSGLLYGMTVAPLEVTQAAFSVILPVGWLTLIGVGSLILGKWLQVQPANLLGGGIIGTLSGFAIFALLVGWSFVMFAIVPITLLALIVGAWGAYEWNRYSASIENNVYDGWRYVFLALVIFMIALPSLLLFA